MTIGVGRNDGIRIPLPPNLLLPTPCHHDAVAVGYKLRGLGEDFHPSNQVRSQAHECGDSSPLLLAATRRGESPTGDESEVERAGASSRTPKLAIMHSHKLFALAGGGNRQDDRITAVPNP